MRRRSPRARLADISEAISGIKAASAGISFEGFLESWSMQRALERGLEIISEASRSVPPEMKTLHPDVPWPQIASIGNQLRHAYDRIDPRIIWNIIERDLPELEAAVSDLIERLDAETGQHG